RVRREVGELERVGGAQFGPELPPAVLARKVVEPVPGRDREVVAARRAHARVAHHLLAPEVGLAARAAAVVGLDPAWPLGAGGGTRGGGSPRRWRGCRDTPAFMRLPGGGGGGPGPGASPRRSAGRTAPGAPRRGGRAPGAPRPPAGTRGAAAPHRRPAPTGGGPAGSG